MGDRCLGRTQVPRKSNELQLFSDGSVQAALPAPQASEITLRFQRAKLIDAASDTGWSIPKEANADDVPYAILTFPTTIVTPANGCFLLSFDVGGHPDFDTPARYRVSFSNE
jgi:hypothetical protein